MQTVVTRSQRRVGSLDGLRAFAVTAVIVYHLDDRLLPGGFLGVDLFFVLSGYLVTTLMLAEHRRSGSVDLRAFWARRARRLWAAAWITLALVSVAGVFGVWGEDRQATLPGEVFAAVAHIANYWQLAHGGYVEQFVAPSPLRHFWSLAVEEQFYFVWPMVMIGGLALVARRGRAAMWALLLGIAATSFAIGLLVSPERAYLGTGTRAIELVAGAVLAWAWSARPMSAPGSTGARRAIAVWASVGVVVLVAGTLTLHPNDAILARGGFVTISLAAAGLIGIALVPGRASAFLSLAPLVWIGRRSYGMYLLHWPLIVAMGPGRPLWQVAAVVVPLTVLGAAVLHRVVEMPLILRRWSPVRMAQGTMVLALVIVGALLVARPSDSTPTEDVAAGLEAVADPVGPDAAVVPSPGGDRPTTSTTTTTICIPAAATGGALATSTVPPDGFDPSTIIDLADPTAERCESQIDVMVVGDSTGRGFSNGLAALADPGLRIWDRTILGCSLGSEECGDWRDEWGPPVEQIRPDVVVMYLNPVDDLKGVDDAPFMSAEATAQRVAVLNEAVDLLSSQGATVVLVLQPAPRAPEGYFFCDGRSRGSRCDPEWVQRWNADVRSVALARELPVLDVPGWLEAGTDDRTTRPDGIHFAGQSLVDLAAWARPTLSLAVLERQGGG